MRRASLLVLTAERDDSGRRLPDLVFGPGARPAPCLDVAQGCLHPLRAVESCCDGCPRTRR